MSSLQKLKNKNYNLNFYVIVMRKFLIILLTLIFSTNIFYAQIVDCTPDPECNEQVAGEGALCPEELLPAYINEYYESVFTLIPISEYEGIEFHAIRVDDITGLPEGFEWGKNEDIFYVTDPPTRYCAMIYGTTENEGEYPMDIYVTPFIYYQPPLGNPIVVEAPQEVIEGAVVLVVLGDPPIADFSAGTVIAEIGENISFYCETIGEVDYRYWTFEDGNPNSSTEENPVVYWDTPGQYDVSLYVENQAGSDSITKENYITILDPVYAYGDIEKRISIYPNPAKNRIIIESDLNITSIHIVDLTGKLLKIVNRSSKAHNLDVSDLGQGNYFLKLFTKQDTFVRRIVIN